MVRFKKIRPRRGSLAVSIICGSPMAARRRSAALAYRIGSLRHDSRYSAIDMSVWLLASKDRAKALNRESLYMIRLSMVTCKCRTLRRGSNLGALQRPFANHHQHMYRLETRATPQCNAIVVLRAHAS